MDSERKARFVSTVGVKAVFTTFCGAAYGASRGYIKGNQALYGALWGGIPLSVFATSFFTGVFCLNEYRGVDDPLHYAIAGGLNSAILVSLSMISLLVVYLLYLTYLLTSFHKL